MGSGIAITQTSGSPNFAWQVSDLPVGAGGVITLTGVVTVGTPSALSGQIITNTAVVAASNDITTTNNSASAAPYRLCGPGEWLETVTNSCQLALPGRYVPDFGYTESFLCLPGTYQPNEGASSCLLAPVDTYVDSSGATSPTACPAGTYNPLQGSVSISDCLPTQTICGVQEAQTYAYNVATTLISVTINTVGDIDCLTIGFVNTPHPSATTNMTDGYYWTITGTTGIGNPITTYNVDLTFPHQGGLNPTLCRYPGGLGGFGWDCTGTQVDNGNTVTRQNVMQFSDWAVGYDVGPTAVTNLQAGANETNSMSSWWLVGVLVGLLGVGTAVFLHHRPARSSTFPKS